MPQVHMLSVVMLSDMLHVVMLSAIRHSLAMMLGVMLNIIMLYVVMLSVLCFYAESQFGGVNILSVCVLSFIMVSVSSLSVLMPSDIMLSANA
jgi:hypothetical protein